MSLSIIKVEYTVRIITEYHNHLEFRAFDRDDAYEVARKQINLAKRHHPDAYAEIITKEIVGAV